MPRPKGKAPLTRFREARRRLVSGDLEVREEMHSALHDAVAACAKSGRLNREMAEQLLLACPLWHKPGLMPDGRVSTFDPGGLFRASRTDAQVLFGLLYIAFYVIWNIKLCLSPGRLLT